MAGSEPAAEVTFCAGGRQRSNCNGTLGALRDLDTCNRGGEILILPQRFSGGQFGSRWRISATHVCRVT